MPNNAALTEIPRHFQAYLTEAGIASPKTGIASPKEGIASPKEGIASPKEGIASPKEGIASPKAGLSHISVKNYVSDIRQFLVWSKLSSARLVTSELISEYLRLIKDTKPEATYRRYMASMRRFVTFLSIEYRLNLAQPANRSEDTSGTDKKEVSLSLGQITEKFKTYLRNEKRTPATIKNYVSDLNHFWAWSAKFLESNQNSGTIDLSVALTPKTLKTYLNHLKVSHITTSVAHRREAAINKFIKFAVDTKLINDTPIHLSPQPLAWFRRYQSTDKLITQATGKQSLYRRYNNLPFVPYFHLALLVLFTTALGLFAYNQIIRQATPQFAFPTALTRPTRQLSFQGRLTDSSDTPISTATDVSFKIWDQLSAGTEGTCTSQAGEDCLYKTGTCSVTPDADGVFNSLIGDGTCGGEIPNTVFSENASVFLEVLVGAQTLTPRQQIATVAYALNSETLQGYPASASAVENTIPVMDNNGDIVLGSFSPTIKSTSGTFGVEGQAISIITTAGTNGNISIAPDGTGAINAIGGTTTQDFLRITNANLTSGSLISGYVGNNTSAGELLRLSSGSSETDRFVVGSFGQTTIDAAAKGKAALIVNQLDTGPLFAASVAGVNKFLITNAGNITLNQATIIDATSTLSLNTTNNQAITTGTGLTTLGGDVTINGDDLNTISTTFNLLAGATTALNIGPAGSSGNIVLSGGSADTGCTLDGTTGNYTCSGNITSIATGTPSVGYWTRNTASGYLYPATATDRIGINSSSPNSTLDVRSNLGTISVASVSGATSMAALVVDNSGVGDIFTASSSGLNRFVIAQNGNVGIGTTVPAYLLDVQGGSGIVAQFSGRVIGADAVNNNEFATLSQVSAVAGPWTRSAPNVYLTTGTDYVGIGTTSPLATIDVRSNLGTIPVASISGATSMAALVVDNSGVGDIFTASSSGLNRFVITQAGNVGIGTTGPIAPLDVVGATTALRNGANPNILYIYNSYTDASNYARAKVGYAGNTFGINIEKLGTGIDSDAIQIGFNGVGLKVVGASNWFGATHDNLIDIGQAAAGRIRTGYFGTSIQDPLLFGGTGTTQTLTLKTTSGVGATGADMIFQVGNNGATEAMRILNNGNVGIGTTAPTSLLHVTGAVKGKALVIFDETGDQNIFSASQSGIPVFNLARVAGTAANGTTFTPAAAGGTVLMAATGSDTDIALSIDSKGADALNLNNNATGDVLLAGGAGATGCTVTNSNGNFSCSGNITASGTSGFQGWWQRNAQALSPTNISDDVLVGSIATASAFTKFSGTPSGNSWINTGYLGIGTITPTAHLAIVGNTWEGLFSINDGVDNIATISSTLSQFNNPVSFTSPGDVAIAYDLNFTNQTASYIKSNAPLYIQVGETFENNDLTLQTFNKGNVIIDSEALVANYAATVASQLVVGTLTAPANIGGFYLTNAATYGKALAILNQTESADIFTASASGVTRFVITSAGNVGIGTATPTGLLDITGTSNTDASLSLTNNTADTLGAAAATGIADFQSTSLTTGTLLNLELTEGTLAGGFYLKAWDVTAGATVFSVGEDGATTIAGVGGSNVFTITAGDAVMSDGSLTITDADNAATLTITNNTATTFGAGINTMGVIDIQSTSLTSGNLVNLEANALTSGKILNMSTTSTALTTGGIFNASASGVPAGSWTGSLGSIEYTTSTSANIDGSVLKLGITGNGTANGAGAGDGTTLYITNGQTGTNALVFRANDDGTYSDSTPFVIDATGLVGIGTTAPSTGTNDKLTVAGDIVPSADVTYELGSSSLEWTKLYLTDGVYVGGTPIIDIATQTLADLAGSSGWNIVNSASVSGTLYVTDQACIDFITASTDCVFGTASMIVGQGTGKINVGTVDPPYTINGERYATFLPGMVGQNEEVAGHIATDEFVDNLGYRKVIDFSNLPKASDLWLFSKVIDVAKHIGQMTVMLTPSSSAKTWYEIDQDKLLLTIYSSKPTSISFRLTAPRFDSDKWTNTHDSGSVGFILNSPDIPLNNLNNDTLIALDPVFTEKNINEYELKLGNDVVAEIGSYAKLLVANITAGLIKAEKLVSPIADIENLSANTISTKTLSVVEGLTANEASVSGLTRLNEVTAVTLYASDIQSPALDSLNTKYSILDTKYASASAILASIKAKYSEFDALNSPVAQTDPLSTSNLDSNNATISGNLSLNTSYSILNTVVADTLLVNTTLVSNSLNSNDTALYLQPTANQPINLLAGLMILTPDGKVAINGDLSVNGNIAAKTLSVVEGLTSANATISGSFTSNTATISGSIASNEIITNGLLIASASTESATASSSAMLSSNSSIGTGIISAGETELKIENSKIKNSTYIYLTPISDSANQVLYIKSKEEGVGFTVSINQALPADIKFSYWLIQTQP